MAMKAFARLAKSSGAGGGNNNKSHRQSTGKVQKKGRRKGRRASYSIEEK